MINTIKIDYNNHEHAQDLLLLLDNYAKDPQGGGQALKPEIKASLIDALKRQSCMHSFICYVDKVPAGFANCIESFSTFNCKPVLNIHDFGVNPGFRGRQLSQALIAKIEGFARDIGACKLTLEVLEGNSVAQKAYIKAGFSGYELDPEMGKAMFWEKKLIE